MKIAYLDCYAGVSGDMVLGALLDAGLPLDGLEAALEGLDLPGWRLAVQTEARHGITGTRCVVELLRHEHAHRRLDDIRRIIEGSNLAPHTQRSSIAAFEALAQAEGAVHGLDPAKVTFHEVGALDSIIDIVGAVYGFGQLGIEQLHVSPLPLGRGFVKSAHGVLPLPAPATLALLEGLPVYDAGVDSETVTPTGAALVKTLAHGWGRMPPLRIANTGHGVGGRDLPQWPNLLRLVIGKASPGPETELLLVLETNLDDMPAEWLGYLMERVLAAGALDAVFIPVQMKKNRPGVQVQVLAHPRHREDLLEVLFQETTALGVRTRYCEREVLARDSLTVESPWGPIKVKRVCDRQGRVRLLPEFEACRTVARSHDLPLRDVYARVAAIDPERVRKG